MFFFFFKRKTAYEMRISDWSSDVCSSDLVREGLKVIPLRDKSGVAYKGYKGDANARFDVWQLPDGKWTAAVVSMFDAHRHDFIPERPHPAAKNIMSLRQNDLLAIEKDGVFREIVRVVNFGANGQIKIGRSHVLTPVTNAHLVCRL